MLAQMTWVQYAETSFFADSILAVDILTNAK